MVELLSPVGDFNCLKAAVQNGADSVYFGADTFNARIFASNFTINDIKKIKTIKFLLFFFVTIIFVRFY